jgi:hypothetical protein
MRYMIIEVVLVLECVTLTALLLAIIALRELP